jgi:hypothetical protein
MRELGDRENQNILNLEADKALAEKVIFARINEAVVSPVGLFSSLTNFF